MNPPGRPGVIARVVARNFDPKALPRYAQSPPTSGRPASDSFRRSGRRWRSERFRVATEGSALRCLHDVAGGEASRKCGGDDPGGFDGRWMWRFSSRLSQRMHPQDDVHYDQRQVPKLGLVQGTAEHSKALFSGYITGNDGHDLPLCVHVATATVRAAKPNRHAPRQVRREMGSRSSYADRRDGSRSLPVRCRDSATLSPTCTVLR